METTNMTTAGESKMKVEVWSDIMCPFCYIGKRRYEAAVQKFAHANDIALEWKSFQLDPTIPADADKGLTATQYLASRKGISNEEVAEMHQQVTQTAENVGLEYHLDNALVYNSFKAHRIIQFAKTKGLGDIAEEIFFNAHFTQNKDLGDPIVLTALAKEAGLTEQEATE